MTSYRFSQSVCIIRQTFKVGIREVPPAVEEHPHFLRYVKAGWIHEVDPKELAPPKPPENARDVATRLAKKIAEKKPKGKPDQVQEPVLEKEPEIMGTSQASAEQVSEGVQDEGDCVDESALTPQQRAARTRKANAEKAKPKEGQ